MLTARAKDVIDFVESLIDGTGGVADYAVSNATNGAATNKAAKDFATDVSDVLDALGLNYRVTETAANGYKFDLLTQPGPGVAVSSVNDKTVTAA
jgi:hypothetical protein